MPFTVDSSYYVFRGLLADALIQSERKFGQYRFYCSNRVLFSETGKFQGEEVPIFVQERDTFQRIKREINAGGRRARFIRIELGASRAGILQYRSDSDVSR